MLEGRKIQNLSPMERIIFLTFLIPFCLWSQNPLDQKPDARSLALGGSGLAQIDSWSGINNPAALAFLDANFLSSSHRQVFGIEALQKSALCGNFKSFGQQVALSLEYFGFEYFNQSKIMLAYGQKLSKSIALGLRLGSEAYYIEAGSSGWVPSVEFFLFGKSASKLQYGLAVKNPFSRKLSQEYRLKPSSFSLGFLYHLKNELHFSFEAESAWKESLQLMSGLEYEISKGLFFRLGSNYSDQLNFSGGAALQWHKFRLNLSYLQSNAWGSEMCIDLNFQL
jgi:opacity protein-like surface antigen